MTGLILSILIPWVTGYLFASWLLARDEASTLLERLFLGLGLGFGILSFEIFLLGLLGISFALVTITVIQFLSAIIFLILTVRAGGLLPKGGVFGCGGLSGSFAGGKAFILIITFGLLGLFALKIGFVFYESLLRPVYSFDSWTNWSAAAKFFYYEGGLMLDSSNEHFFGSGYREFLGHPLQMPLLEVWSALWVGSFHEAYVKIHSALYYVGLAGVLFYGLKRRCGALYALLWSWFLASLPLIVFHATDAYSDLALAYYTLAGIVFFYRFIEEGSGAKQGAKLLMISALFLAMAVFTKNEGLIFYIAAGIVVALFIKAKGLSWRLLLSYVVPFIVIAGPWLIFKIAFDVGYGHSGAGSEMEWLSDPKYAEGAERGLHFEVFWLIFKEYFFRHGGFNLIVPFWIVLSVFGIRTVVKSELRYLYIFLLLVIGAFLFIYLTLEVTAVTQRTGLNRNLMTYIPVITFTSALLLVRVWARKE